MNQFIRKQLAVPAWTALAAAALCGGAQAAAVVNGNFEGGTLTGWYASGANVSGSSTAIVNSGNGYPALAGNNSALIVAMSTWPLGPNVTCATDIWNVACPQPAPFSPAGAAAPTYTSLNINGRFLRGGYLAQDVTVEAGDELEWAHQLLGEVSRSIFVDNAWFIASNGVSEFVVDLRSSINSFVFTQGGLWSIYFGVQQTEDPYIWSALKLDSVAFVQAADVPEPASGALLVAALGALAVARRRRVG